MSISQADFAAALRGFRPGLVRRARYLRRCNLDDASDLVCEAVLYALAHLEKFSEEDGVEGLRAWLDGILKYLVYRDLRKAGTRVAAAPIEEAEAVEAAPSDRDPEYANALRSIPANHRAIVLDWLEGYGRDEIGRRNRLHRNTVSARLREALQAMKAEFPDQEDLAFALALFASCARVTIYRKPAAVWLPWSEQHPAEAAFRRAPRRRAGPGNPKDKTPGG